MTSSTTEIADDATRNGTNSWHCCLYDLPLCFLYSIMSTLRERLAALKMPGCNGPSLRPTPRKKDILAVVIDEQGMIQYKPTKTETN